MKHTKVYLHGYNVGIISRPEDNPHSINPYKEIRDREKWYAGYVAGGAIRLDQRRLESRNKSAGSQHSSHH